MEKKNKLITFIKSYLPEILIIAGTGCFFRNVFNFQQRTNNEFTFGDSVSLGTYWYTDTTRFLIALGAMMFALGVLLFIRRYKI